jgi:hypothetical protein
MNSITSSANFINIYKAVQNICINHLYLKPATPLGRFCPTIKNSSGFQVISLPLYRFCTTVNFMPWLPLLHQLKIVCDVTMVNQQCKQSQTIAEKG